MFDVIRVVVVGEVGKSRAYGVMGLGCCMSTSMKLNCFTLLGVTCNVNITCDESSYVLCRLFFTCSFYCFYSPY